MKILDYCINEYFKLSYIKASEDLKGLQIFKRKPNNFTGFYILEKFDSTARQVIWQLRERCLD